MVMEETTNTIGMPKHRLTRGQKLKNNKQWYKDNLNFLDSVSFNRGNLGFDFHSYDNMDDFHRMKINYDLFNNIIDINDFEYITKPYGEMSGELPANFTNRDIISPKIKVLLGMEMKRPFAWKVIAVNEEATTRREQEEFGRMRDFVIQQIMTPLRVESQKKKQAELQGQQLTPEQEKQIQQQVEQELQAQTPEEVKRYMLRDHQDPAEVLANQLLEYLFHKENIPNKFNKGFKHLCISGKEIYHITIVNGEPVINTVNSLYFDHDKSSGNETIEDGEWATQEMFMTPSEIMTWFGDELTVAEIDDIYSYHENNSGHISSNEFNFDKPTGDDGWTIRVLHGVWKALRRIGFLKYKDMNGAIQMRIVDESYKINKALGDISISWQWIPRTYEGYKIGRDKYVGMQPVDGQDIDLDNLFNCKLPYIGTILDGLNSDVTSIIDRLKSYQYYYNIIMYRIELLMASDKGKILLMNIGAIPESAGIDIEKWMYYVDSSKYAFYNPNEEGNRGDPSAGSMAKEIDMSLASDIQKYISLAEYIDRRAGTSIGVPPEAEGQIGPNQAVTNTKQTLTQSSHVLEPIFDLHNHVKKNALQYLLDVAKVAYADSEKKKLNYILDDLSRHMLNVDSALLNNSTFGIFVSNSSKAHEVKELISQLAHAAMQSQKIDLSDVVKVIKSEGVQEAEEMLEASEERKRQEMQREQMAQLEKQQEMQREMIAADKEKREYDRETELLKINTKGKWDVQKQAMLSMGFNEDKDVDKDGKLDVLEVAKQGVDVNIKQRKQALDEKEFSHKKKMEEEKLKLDKKKDNNT